MKDNSDYEKPCVQLIKFCKKLSKQPESHKYLYKTKMYSIALKHIAIKDNEDLEEMDEKDLMEKLQTIHKVLRMVKHLFEGQYGDKAEKDDIVEAATEQKAVIEQADRVLDSSRTQNNHDLAVIIVNIIICFNSIQNTLTKERVMKWIKDFSHRLCDHIIEPKHNPKQSHSWYLEKYVFIIELLVTKNLEIVDEEMTHELLKIYEINLANVSNFSKTIWYKLLKILAHLQHLQGSITEIGKIDQIFNFIIKAYNMAREDLSFLYFLKVVMLLTKGYLEEIYASSQYFKSKGGILDLFDQFFKKHHKVTSEALQTEIVLY